MRGHPVPPLESLTFWGDELKQSDFTLIFPSRYWIIRREVVIIEE
jgi:hypothetical protein